MQRMETGDLKEKAYSGALKIKLNSRTGTFYKIILDCIRNVEEVYLKTLITLICIEDNNLYKNGETGEIKIEIDCLINYISDKNKTDGKKIIDALNFWKRKEILNYSCISDSSGILTNLPNLSSISRITNSSNFSDNNSDSDNDNNGILFGEKIDRISETLETQSNFRRLVHDIQQKFRTIFNPTELDIMFNLYKINKIEIELLYKLADICVLEEKTNASYLEKIALGLVSNGVFTAEQHERNYNEMLKVKEYENLVRQVFKLEDHKFTLSERNYIKKWALEFEFGEEILAESYDICVDRIKELKFGYINGILTNWNAKGFTSVEDIRNEFLSGEGASTIGARPSNFNIDLFYERAVKKAMYTEGDAF